MSRRLTVLVSFPPPTATSVNPYTILLAENVHREGARVLYFHWMSALFDDYDVFHVHWPENLVGGRTPLRRLVRQLLTLLVLVRLTVTRRALVRTVHNLDLPEGLSRGQLFVLRMIDRRTDFVIRLNGFTPVPASVPFATIPHPHFREWFASFDRAEPVPGQVGYVGRIRRYKGVESLIGALGRVDAGHGSSPEVALSARIAGYPSSAELADQITRLASDNERISLEFGFISDTALVTIVTSSELVVLPYRAMHNSAAALTALSLDRPVLVPENPVTRALAIETGEGWVHTFRGELSHDDVVSAIAAVHARGDGSTSPRFSGRSWSRTARSHIEAYTRAARIARYSRNRTGYSRSTAR